MKHPKEYKMFFHITDILNLESILKYGLHPRCSLKQFTSFSDIADVEILELRNKSNLDKYVPFHFIPNSPFAGKIQIDNPDKNFIYICLYKSYVEDPLHKNNFKVLPYHPLHDNNSNDFKIYDYDIGIEKINWDLMHKRNYKDGECKQVCMAELLSLKPIMIDGAHIFIRVKDNHTKDEVLNILQEYDKYDIHVNIQKEWFVKSKNDF